MRKGSRDAGNRKNGFNALRDISTSLEYARRTAYDQTVFRGDVRKRVTFSLMAVFLDERRNKAAMRSTHADLGSDKRYWQHMLTSARGEESRLHCAARERYYISLLREKEKSLSTACLHSIAQHAGRFCIEDMHFALSTLPHSATELFSLLSCLYDAQSDAIVQALNHEFLERVYFSRKVTDAGVEALLARFLSVKGTQFELLDSWEQIDPTEITTSASMGLREIYLLSSGVSLTSIELIRDTCLHLQKLSLHDVEFCGEKEQSNATVLCSRILEVVSSGFSNLVSLELLCCSWVHSDVLLLWARRLAQQRSEQKTILPSLESLTIAKTMDALEPGAKATADNGQQYAELSRILRCDCNVTLIVLE
jgi:hypothetical protein